MCGGRARAVPHFRRFEGIFPSIWRMCGAVPKTAPHIRRFEGPRGDFLPSEGALRASGGLGSRRAGWERAVGRGRRGGRAHEGARRHARERQGGPAGDLRAREVLLGTHNRKPFLSPFTFTVKGPRGGTESGQPRSAGSGRERAAADPAGGGWVRAQGPTKVTALFGRTACRGLRLSPKRPGRQRHYAAAGLSSRADLLPRRSANMTTNATARSATESKIMRVPSRGLNQLPITAPTTKHTMTK